MRAARLHEAADGGTRLEIEDVDDLEPSPLQVLVTIRAAGVCGSDAEVVDGRIPTAPLPLVAGHEAAGVVADVGAEVAGWRPGDRVLLHAGTACGDCGYCTAGRQNLCEHRRVAGIDLDGYLAEQALVDPRYLSPLPPELDFAEAALLGDAVATPYHALKRAGIGDGVVCAVFGLGGLGLHAVQLAGLAGATVVGVDVDEVALQRALAWGAEQVVDASEHAPHLQLRALTDGGVDRALEFVGTTRTVDQVLKSVKPGGRAVVAGLTPEPLELLPGSLLVAEELELVGSFGATAQDVGELIDLVEAGRLDLSRSVTHRVGLDELPRAVDWLRTREERPVRTVVELG